jgi:molybdopterin-guanine dinucleotide biosynthesis protein A
MSAPDHPPLYGVVLAGGRSRRMRQDKALLCYAGRPQVAVAYDLLREFVEPVFVSCRAGQWDDPAVNDLPQLYDTLDNVGPIGGILRAFEHDPEVAWLVVACDLPLLTRSLLEGLVGRRDPACLATAFRASGSGLPEPMCAVYEPAASTVLHDYLARGIRCPRKFLINEPSHLLDLPDGAALTNVNEPEEYDRMLNRRN